ncbi:MAG: hypothetical protein KBA31_18190 [Alphaproteobacteria bacterium]|nr:hypothetical protein [Alphaproteobacteria bacterium]
MKLKLAAAAAAILALLVSTAHSDAFDPNDDGQAAYVEGNLLFLTYHEVGHMILDQVLDVDQHGDRRASEEDADDIATWLMLPDEDEPEQDDDIWAAMQGWMRGAELQQGVAQSPHYPDDAERASRIACYLYGSNPSLYPQIAKAFSVSIASVNCTEEVAALKDDLEDWFGDAMIPPAEPGARVRIDYQPAAGTLAEARNFLIQSRVLEEAAEDISEFVSLPNEISLVAQSCGTGAAEFRYSPSARRITACYEAVDWLMRDASGEQQEIASGASAGGDELGSGGARVTRRPRPRGGR